jgi:protein-tyrosine phosphatase
LYRLLLHTETPDGSVDPIWEDVQSQDVEVLQEIMASREFSEDGFELVYHRIPITAENPPDSSDLHDLIDVVASTDWANTPIVVNCQLGRGRSTMASASNIFAFSLHFFERISLDHPALD